MMFIKSQLIGVFSNKCTGDRMYIVGVLTNDPALIGVIAGYITNRFVGENTNKTKPSQRLERVSIGL